MGGRLIGPTLPPWIADEKKIESDLERLSKADPATLRAKVMELETQVTELNQLLTYREDVILRIHEVSFTFPPSGSSFINSSILSNSKLSS